ncbi:hypothetical protein Tco_1004369 [Tanacetum coccineum]|uniref:Uncharacterized protein n=1 Tax=Tanacetum coccineum TaxID=301880 RepID=A0ABQ5FC45_9ASTR
MQFNLPVGYKCEFMHSHYDILMIGKDIAEKGDQSTHKHMVHGVDMYHISFIEKLVEGLYFDPSGYAWCYTYTYIQEGVTFIAKREFPTVIDLFGAEMESLLGIVVEEGDRYHRMSSFMMKVLKGVTKKDRDLVWEVSHSISRTHWSLCDLMDSVVDRDCIIDKDHVSGVIEDYRAKIINELNELHDNLSTDSCNTTTKQMIKDYIVAFKGGVEHEEPADADLAKRLHKSEELQMMILLNYAPIKNKSSTIISKKSDDEMITKKRKFEGQLCSSRSLKQPKYIYQEDEDVLDTWDCGPGNYAGTVDVLCYSRP